MPRALAHGTANTRNPSDNSLAVGPNHIVEIVNSRMAIYSKKGSMYDTPGTVLYGAVPARFAARLGEDPSGALTFRETILIEGQASQTNTLRWEDYTTTAMDPSDDCTFWYAGDYLKAGATSYRTRIGSFRLPGCMRAVVSGTSYFDLDHNGRLDPGEPGLPGRWIDYSGGQSGKLTTDANGSFNISLPADPAYQDPTYIFSEQATVLPGWTRTGNSSDQPSRSIVSATGSGATVTPSSPAGCSQR